MLICTGPVHRVIIKHMYMCRCGQKQSVYTFVMRTLDVLKLCAWEHVLHDWWMYTCIYWFYMWTAWSNQTYLCVDVDKTMYVHVCKSNICTWWNCVHGNRWKLEFVVDVNVKIWCVLVDSKHCYMGDWWMCTSIYWLYIWTKCIVCTRLKSVHINTLVRGVWSIVCTRL